MLYIGACNLIKVNRAKYKKKRTNKNVLRLEEREI